MRSNIQKLTNRLFNRKSWHQIILSILILTFLCFNFFSRKHGGPNEMSRLAVLESMYEENTFSIDSYKNWTIDWAQTPNGHYYSNKAPGSILLGYPIYYALRVIYTNKTDYPIVKHLLSFFMQVIPYVIFVIFLLKTGSSQGLKQSNTAILTAVILFGNTAPIFSSVYMGHTLSAIFFALMTLFFFDSKYKRAGFCYGLLVLNEYFCFLTIIPLLICIALEKKQHKLKIIFDVIKGGVIPGIFWIWYHSAVTGNPFLITTFFQNPMWKSGDGYLLGIFSKELELMVLFEVLFGMKRGLLVTIPWFFFLLKFNLNTKKLKILFITTCWLIYILLNTQFNGWHGGYTSGPRYLAFMMPITYYIILLEQQSFIIKKTFLITSYYSIYIGTLIMFASPLAPLEYNLIKFLLEKSHIKFATILCIIVIMLTKFSSFLCKKESRP